MWKFPPRSPDQRIGLIAAVAVQAVDEHGNAEIVGVPGDQLAGLRRAIQRELRAHYGPGGHTWAVNDLLVVSHNNAVHSHAALQRENAVVQSLYTDPPPVCDTDWRIHWHTWATP